jgi:predicted O-linked N-acetylglucosamine transferase (SPINDLY family)
MSVNLSKTIIKIIDLVRANRLTQDSNLIGQALSDDLKNAEYIFQLGLSCANVNRLDDAVIIFNHLQAHSKNDIRIPYNLGIIFSMQGLHEKAIEAYDLALKINSEDVEVLVNKGSACNDMGDYFSALLVLDYAIQIQSNIPEAWSNKGIALNHLRLFQEAVIAYNEAIRLKPNYFEALSNRSVPLNKLKHYAQAIESCDRAIELKPGYVEAWSNKGVVLNTLKRYEEAITHYDKAISLKPDYAEAWSNKGVVLNTLKRYEEAITHYDKAISLKPDYAEAWSNKGVTLYELKCYEEAITHYDKAISLKSDYAEAWLNKGVSFQQLKYFNEALTFYDKALSLQPESIEAWANKGIALHELNRYRDASFHYEKALSLKPDLEWIFGDLMYLKLKICSWERVSQALALLPEKIHLGEKIITPFPLLALTDDPLLHQQCAQIYSQEKHPFNPALGPIGKRSQSAKIRIAYFSADFGNHPVSMLTAELFELHDRNGFEIIAFSFGPNDHSPMRSRLESAFDQFIDVSKLSDQEIAALAREQQIDIAIDLGGHTKGARTDIFAYRAAPIQVGYIGYLGTMGAPYMDYILSDKIISPQGTEKYFSEKIAYLPSYQVNDRKRVISPKQFSRQELGLPEHGFVFCCFNNNFKILPEVFDSWMQILHAVEGSVLFLYAENQWVQNHLEKESQARGIGSERLIFGEQLPVEEYLARYRSCDLFLDTAPYNAGTTASDALRVGLPVLTLPGQSFASRVATSLLQAIELPELIATSRANYEALAIELANHPTKLAQIKQKLAHNRQTTPLFNTPLFTSNLEKAYTQMYVRYQADLPPERVVVE